MKIVFVHTPMSVVKLPERKLYWEAFDRVYHQYHPDLREMVNPLWELPHWMPWLAGVLEANGFKNIDAINPNSMAMTKEGGLSETSQNEIIHCDGDVFLLSPMIPNLHNAITIARFIKKHNHKSIVILGGIAVSALKNEVIENNCIDYVISGRGEIAIVKLLEAINNKNDTNNSPLKSLSNLSFKDEFGEVFHSNFEYKWLPVNEIPFPKINLFPRSLGRDLRYLRIVYGLGCPYNCSFCTIQTIRRKPDFFLINRVISEIKAYKEYYGEHHYIYFGDETFTLNKERTLQFCNALEREGGIHFDCQTRLNCISDKKILKALSRAGCKWVEIGIENLTPSGIGHYKQRTRISQLEENLARIKEAGIGICFFLVNGLPKLSLKEMEDSIDNTCRLIEKGLLDASYLFGLVPYPGSAMFNNPQKYGIDLIHFDYSKYNEDLPPVYNTEFATSPQIHNIFKNGIIELTKAMDSKVSKKVINKNYGQFWSSNHV